MVKRYGCAGILLFAMGLFPLLAQDNAVAKEMAIKIADRIVASTVYEFKDVKTGKVYTSLDNVSLNPDMRVNSKYLNWHYTNGVTNMALMELGDKIQNRWMAGGCCFAPARMALHARCMILWRRV